MTQKPVKQRLICKRLSRIGYDRADVDAPFGMRRRDVWLAEVQIMGIFLTPPPCIAVTGFLITCMIFSFLDFRNFVDYGSNVRVDVASPHSVVRFCDVS